MQWKTKNGKIMEIAYSQKLQLKIVEALNQSNLLKIILIGLIGLAIVIFGLVYFQTGIIGTALRGMVC